MKGLVKWIALTALITAAIIILTNRSRQRATAPEAAWQPPTVTPPPAEEAPAAPDDAQAEAETLREMAAEAEALSIAAEQIAAASPLVVGIGKQAFYRQRDMPLHEAYRYASDVMASNAQLADAQEGMCAFLEKRKPQWRGQ